MRRLLGVVGLAMALAACGSSSSYGGGGSQEAPTSASAATGTASCPPPDGAALQQLVGLSEQQAAAQAAANGWPFRVAERDGEQLLLTQDYNEERVNVAVQNGVVTRAWSG